MSYAIVFPGQGAQETGMGKDFYDSSGAAKDVFREADEALGFSLSGVIFGGTEEDLAKTAVTQPAILTVSVAIMRTVCEELGGRGKKLEPAFYAGHSLGEYTALTASGALSFADAVRLVHKRGRLMQSAVPLGRGAMSAVLGLDVDALSDICREAGGVCGPANANAPGQVVISGETEAVERAGVLAKERGALKVVPLKVSAPFHCELMRPVADELDAEFRKLVWNDPSVPITANVDSSFLVSSDAIQKALYRQTYSPVLWADGVRAMESAGVSLFLEFGPGSVLSGLIKRTCKGKKTQAVNKLGDVIKAIEAIEEAVA
ncbi:MAG: ACP S-malonyltransferase [Synergistaceae bacterium]|jgi:[acyl-carrier-protein] S-malonyltransferase|nr:ACP S-malonyltransferase [Synergistaceae bacterium]